MNGNGILKYGRTSVLKWAGKNFTGSDVNWNSTEGILTVKTIQAHTMLPQKCNRSSIFDASPEDQEPIKSEDFFPSNSRNAKKIHICVVCNKTFKWRSHLVCHERIHTGEKPFRCDICFKAFKRSDGLQCHKKTHFRIKVDGDGANGNSFVLDQAALKQHNIFACTICGRTFASHAGYSRHIENKHKGSR